MFDYFYPDFLPDYGPYVDERGMMPAFGNAAGKYFLQQSAWPYNTSNKEATYHLFHHHGGAFLTVYSEVPQNLMVIHDSIQFCYENTFTIQADQSALIALTVDGEIIGTAGGTGETINISYELLPTGSVIIVTVTKQNFLRYEKTVEVVSPDGSYLVFNSCIVNDSGASLENGQLDYGESVGLNIGLKNIGTESAVNVTATLSTLDPYITITQNSAVFGNIASGTVVNIMDAFSLEVSENIPDVHDVNFEIEATDGNTVWINGFTITANAPLLELEGVIVDDAAGNNNGFLDPGETAQVAILLVNNGHAPAFSVSGTLTTNDPYLSVETTVAQLYGNLLPLQTKTALFTVSVTSSVPMGYIAGAVLQLTAVFGLSLELPVQFEFIDYCFPTAICIYGDGITGFSLMEINNMDNGCSDNGYSDFTSMVANLELGETYTVDWTSGYSNQQACLWIDLNSNKDFEPSELLIDNFVIASSNVVYNTNFTVPLDVNPGNKRMRIRAQYQNSASDPCMDFSYGETEDYTVLISDVAPEMHEIYLPKGWSGLSSYLIPFNTDFEVLFVAVMDDLVIIQNPDGTFWPGQSVNTLGSWDSFSAYQIKMDAEITLTVIGEFVDPAAVQLESGWNLLPLLSPCQVSTNELFASYLADLVVLKEVAGTGVFWPSQGINTLPVMYPGKSYFVLLANNIYLEFEP